MEWKPNRKGCVLEFAPNLSQEEMEKIVQELFRDAKILRLPKIHEWDDRWGSGPVWYVP